MIPAYSTIGSRVMLQHHHHHHQSARRRLLLIRRRLAEVSSSIISWIRDPSLCYQRCNRSYYHSHSQRELVRKYVGRQLSEYYAQPAENVVGRRGSLSDLTTETATTYESMEYDDSSPTTTNNPLTSLWGEWHWKRVFQKLYDSRQGHWLTPVELFKPYYSHILANFCANQAGRFLSSETVDDDSVFEIIELGCGRGTNAALILSNLKQSMPETYDRLGRYTLVDASPSLHKWQQSVLGNGEHSHKLEFTLVDLADVAEKKASLLSKSDTPTIVLGLEVLDNLPHDKVRGKTRKVLEQAEVHWDATSINRQQSMFPKEVFVPLTDPLLQMVVSKVPSFVSAYPRWVPSVACGVVQHLLHQRPNIAMALADFDWLPQPDLPPNPQGTTTTTAAATTTTTTTTVLQHVSEPAEGEPIVTDMSGQDHECYLTAPKYCDVLFPTNFQKVKMFVTKCLSRYQSKHLQVQIQKQSEFLQEWGPNEVIKTQSWTGHNPLLHDFVNCSVLTITFQQKNEDGQDGS
ncbi:putative S-adenosyl-L-methionine-dependent methyltransferase [Nitzschia inconspicua]|uniref:Protein arginine methyltransferase NDUFAF7 n=1 Tax=Nitzschia inconspicua TaxID=303405 RepID=A0A9K3LC17_9STRA|nr:putative S-adenosyl-L-methionine-dependent methyltransferase [Nitzschia inconspicua]